MAEPLLKTLSDRIDALEASEIKSTTFEVSGSGTDFTTSISYSSISGTIVGAVIIGGVNNVGNDRITKIIPYVPEGYKYPTKVHVTTSTSSTTYLTILVFYK